MSHLTVYNFVPPCPCPDSHCESGSSNWVQTITQKNKKHEGFWEDKPWVQEFDDEDPMGATQMSDCEHAAILRAFAEHILSMTGFVGGTADERNWFISSNNFSSIDRCIIAKCYLDPSSPTGLSSLPSPSRFSSDILHEPCYAASDVAEALFLAKPRFTLVQWYYVNEWFFKWTEMRPAEALKRDTGKSSMKNKRLLFRPWSSLEREYREFGPKWN